MMRICEIFTCIGNPETLTTLLSLGKKRLLTSCVQSFDTRRDTHNFYYADCYIWPNKRACTSRSPTGLVSPRLKNQLASPSVRSQPTACLKITKIPSPSLPGMTSYTSLSHFSSGVFIMTSMIVTSSVREREYLRSICVTARAQSRIVLI